MQTSIPKKAWDVVDPKVYFCCFSKPGLGKTCCTVILMSNVANATNRVPYSLLVLCRPAYTNTIPTVHVQFSPLPVPQKMTPTVCRNLKSLLMCSFFNPSQPTKSSCNMCSGINCPWRGNPRTGTTDTTMATGSTYPVRQSVDCNSRDVVYVMSCRKYAKKGEGKTFNPKQR